MVAERDGLKKQLAEAQQRIAELEAKVSTQGMLCSYSMLFLIPLSPTPLPLLPVYLEPPMLCVACTPVRGTL